MRVTTRMVLACALLAPLVAHAQPGGPLEAALRFFEAKSCADAWSMYSSATQDDIRYQVRRRDREREGASQHEDPKQMYCSPRGKLKGGSARVTRQQGDEAVVAAQFTVRVVSDYRLLPSSQVETVEVRLIREAGAWRVDRPRAKRLVSSGIDRFAEIGPVDVRLTVGGGGMHSTLEATGIVPTRGAPLEAALSDPKIWLHAIPSVKAVEFLGPEGESERVRLTFTDADQSMTILARPASKPRNASETVTAVGWSHHGGPRGSPFVSGSWKINPYPDGTRITLRIVFDPRPWPKGGVGEQVFSEERAAEAVLALEKAALKTAP